MRAARYSFVIWLFLLCLLVLGCSRSHRRHRHLGPPPDGGAPDAGLSSDGSSPDADVPEPVPTTFTLENIGSAPLVLGGQCGGTSLALSHDGEGLVYERSCSCACDAPDACGCPAICLQTQKLVVPGKSASVEWDGLYASFEADSSCYELAGFERGETLTAEACWNQSPEATAAGCESVEFAYDVEREVQISAAHGSAARTPQRIVLENQTGVPIDIVTDECGWQRWFQLALPVDDDESATIGTFCACSCDAGFELDACPECGGCSETIVETVQPGARHAFEWDGMFWYGYASGCSQQYAMPAGFFLNSQLCFSREGEDICQPAFFTTGESDEIVLTAQ